MDYKPLPISSSPLVNEVCDLKAVVKNIPYNLQECRVTEDNCEDLKLAMMKKTAFPIKDALDGDANIMGWKFTIIPTFNLDAKTKLPSIMPFIPVVQEQDKTISIIANMHMLKLKKAVDGSMAYTADQNAIIDFLTLAYVCAFAVVCPQKLRINDGLFRNLVDMYVSMIYGSVFRGTTLATDENNLRIITFYVARFLTEGMLKEPEPSFNFAKSISVVRDDYYNVAKLKYPSLILTFDMLITILSKEIPAIAVKKFNTIFAHQSWNKSFGSLFGFSMDYMPYLITLAYTRQMQYRYSTAVFKTTADKAALNVSSKVKDIIL